MTEVKRRGRATHWTAERCIQALEDFVRRTGHSPRIIDMSDRNNLPPYATFSKQVGKSPAQYSREQGHDRPQMQRKHKRWDAERCKATVDSFVEREGRLPRVVYEMTAKFGLPTPSTFTKHTGETIGQYLQNRFPHMIEKKRSHPKANKWTADSIQAALDGFFEARGRAPKSAEYHSKYGLPSHNTVLAHLGITTKEYFRRKHSAGSTWSPDEIKAAFEKFHDMHGRYPKTYELGADRGLPVVSTILRHTGEKNYRSFCEHYLSYTPKGTRSWTKAGCIQAVELFIEKTGRYPKIADCTAANGLPRWQTFQRMTDQTVSQYCKQKYPEIASPNYWSKEACIKAVDDFIAEQGRCPTVSDCGAENELPQYATFLKRVGKTVLEYCKENYPPTISARSARKGWTRTEICEAIEAFAEREGRMPTTEEFLAENHLPSIGTVLRKTGVSAGAFMREQYPEYYDSPQKTQNFGFGMQML